MSRRNGVVLDINRLGELRRSFGDPNGRYDTSWNNDPIWVPEHYTEAPGGPPNADFKNTQLFPIGEPFRRFYLNDRGSDPHLDLATLALETKHGRSIRKEWFIFIRKVDKKIDRDKVVAKGTLAKYLAREGYLILLPKSLRHKAKVLAALNEVHGYAEYVISDSEFEWNYVSALGVRVPARDWQPGYSSILDERSLATFPVIDFAYPISSEEKAHLKARMSRGSG